MRGGGGYLLAPNLKLNRNNQKKRNKKYTQSYLNQAKTKEVKDYLTDF